MTSTLYLKSFDRYDDILEYHLPDGRFAVIGRQDFSAFGIAPTLGTFSRELEHVAGVFASPDGPVFFLDAQRVLCRFRSTTARVVQLASVVPMWEFILTHVDPAGGKTQFTVFYKERIGIGANPYDTEQVDVDMFAMLAQGLLREEFFKNYTKECADTSSL